MRQRVQKSLYETIQQLHPLPPFLPKNLKEMNSSNKTRSEEKSTSVFGYMFTYMLPCSTAVAGAFPKEKVGVR